MDILTVADPRYADAAKTMIDVEITTEVGARPLPFTAMASDPEPLGRALFAELVAGLHGAIAPYVPPPANVPRPDAKGPTIVR